MSTKRDISKTFFPHSHFLITEAWFYSKLKVNLEVKLIRFIKLYQKCITIELFYYWSWKLIKKTLKISHLLNYKHGWMSFILYTSRPLSFFILELKYPKIGIANSISITPPVFCMLVPILFSSGSISAW